MQQDFGVVGDQHSFFEAHYSAEIKAEVDVWGRWDY
jgi:hypothetical protein